MPDLVKLVFNGREVEAEAGTPIIALSQRLGQEIPHFCYHPGIGADGNCRMCLVELAGSPKLVTACTLTAAEGQTITTNSEKVIKARKGVLEFILINHPLDCPICDKGGECPLQEYTRLHGPAHSRMGDPKNLSFKHRVIGEHIIFDSERCILCSRCVRYQRDVVGREELLLRMRGDHAVVDLYEDRPLTSGFTGNLADICPVGALTTREFRFQARPWEMKAVPTSCGGCSLHCAATAWWKGDALMRLTADADHAVNDWWICDRGRFGYAAEDSPQDCLVRRQGEQVPVTFAEAAERARVLLRDVGPRAAVLAGSRATDEELAALAALQARLRPDLSPFPVTAAQREALAALEAGGRELTDLRDLDGFARVIVLGADPELSHPILSLRLGQAAARRALPVTLVHAGSFAPPSAFSRAWRRVSSEPLAWLRGEGQRAMAGEGPLLVLMTESLLAAGALASAGAAAKVLVLHEGMNRRGLLRADAALPAGARGELLAALEAGEIDTLLIVGMEPAADFAGAGRARWEAALTKAVRIILQSQKLEALAPAAEVLLARRRAVDLEGTVTNGWGLRRALRTWRPVAGRRPLDLDWLAPLLPAERADALEVSGGH